MLPALLPPDFSILERHGRFKTALREVLGAVQPKPITCEERKRALPFIGSRPTEGLASN